jgi:hypothetical protein
MKTGGPMGKHSGVSEDAGATEVTVEELMHALDNSTPYPFELSSGIAEFMAKRLLEMVHVFKRPSHPVWQPESPPPAAGEPSDPDTLQGLLVLIEAQEQAAHADLNRNHERGLVPLSDAEMDAEW